MEDYERWSYKIVYYVYYNDEGNMYPVFCVEPAKKGVGTGYDSYTAIINNVEDMYSNGIEKQNQIWRILMKGYMGTKWTDWDLECDDDFYSATKIALHSLAEGVAPDEKYILGNRSVDGNTVEDIQRRGEKVLNLAQELYEYGLYGSECYQKPIILIEEDGEPSTESIENVEYFIQDYLISTNKYLQSYDISIKNFPEGTIILNSNNEEIINSNTKNIRIAVPINNIKEDVNGTIFIQNALIKTNPIYYCESIEEGAQSYVTYNNRYEMAEAEINLNIKANTANLLIKKIDEDTGLPLSNVKFEILDSKKSKITDLITNENGEAIIEGIYPQKVYVKEIEAPIGYVLDTKEKEVELIFNKISEVKFTNEKQKGIIEITKQDSENPNIKLENVEFEIKDSKDQVVETLTTDKYGKAISSELIIGKYKIHEIATNKNYILSTKDIEVNVNYNEVSKVNVENEPRKGQIRIIKVDKNNSEIKLEGVEFEVLDEKGNVLEKIITNDNGEAITKEYAIKDYSKLQIRETKTLENYILNDEIKTIVLEAGKISEIIFENEKKKEPEPEVIVEVEPRKLPRTGH